jgi:hypothetical protein
VQEDKVTISIEMTPHMRDTLAARFRRDRAGVHDDKAFNRYLCDLLNYTLTTKPVKSNVMQTRRSSPQ